MSDVDFKFIFIPPLLNTHPTDTFRPGTIGALLDIYEQAVLELKKAIECIADEKLEVIIDPPTADENCRSLQSILSHVIHAGYGYAISIHNLQGDHLKRPDKRYHTTIHQYIQELADMFVFTEKIFQQLADQVLAKPDPLLTINAGWGKQYDMEQMTEHAIVHILRHKRQVEKMKVQMLNTTRTLE